MISKPAREQLHAEMTMWRRHLHAHPEFGFTEHKTQKFIAEKLASFGITRVEQGVGQTGIVATLTLGTANRAIALRADMDALKITETGQVEHRSKTPGLMHACGHDGHVSMLLGAAKHLAETGGFDGTVYLIFQPAEEWGRGMQAMLDDGLRERFPFQEAYGIHNMPGINIGEYATRAGPFMGGEDNFEITLTGLGGHASRPHEGQDALVAACATVVALQNIVSRAIDPADLAVVSVTELVTDGTRNAIAGSARILGDCRSFSPLVSQQIEKQMIAIAEGVAQAHNCSVSVQYSREFIPTINDEDRTKDAIAAALKLVVDPKLVNGSAARVGASEDFARLLEQVPGNYTFIGNGDSAPLHNSNYDFDDAALLSGADYFVQITRDRLPETSEQS